MMIRFATSGALPILLVASAQQKPAGAPAANRTEPGQGLVLTSSIHRKLDLLIGKPDQ